MAQFLCFAIGFSVHGRPSPVGTAFTFQGRLVQGGNPVDASADFQFMLFDALNAGSQIGVMQPANGIAVTAGNFTVVLDFGAAAFGSDARWLEIAVRSPAGSGVFTPLTPRQQVHPVPVAQFAMSTGVIANASLTGTYSNALSLTNAANIFSGSGAGLTGLNAANITSGTLGSGLLQGTYGGAVSLNNTSNSFTGSGANITNLNASNLTSGTVPSARLSGSYGNALTMNNASNSFTGSFAGNGALLFQMNAIGIESGNLNSARMPTGGAWSLSSLLNLDLNTLVVDAVNNRVGIGTATPIQTLEVEGLNQAAATSGSAANGIARFGPIGSTATLDIGYLSSPAHAWIQSRDAANYATNFDLVLNPNGGNVGIGTTSPHSSYRLTLRGDGVSSAEGGIGMYQGANAGVFLGYPVVSDTTNFELWNNNNGFLRFGTNGVERMRMTSTGNVGIGTTSPETRLHVSAGSPGSVPVTGAVAMIVESSGQSFIQVNSPTSWTEGILFGNPLHGAAGQIVYAPTSNSMRLFTDAAERVRITSTGDVGIGTTSPAQRLHVNGSIQASCGVLTCSDARFKTHVKPLAHGLDAIAQLHPVTFQWDRRQFPDRNFPSGTEVGFIAQDVEDVVPSIVSTGRDGYKSVDYGRVTPLLVQAVKDLRAEKDQEIAQLRTAMDEKDAEIGSLSARVAELEHLVHKMLATNGIGEIP